MMEVECLDDDAMNIVCTKITFVYGEPIYVDVKGVFG